MKRYDKGRRFEYKVKHLFEKHGWTCVRAASSKPIDLVCFKGLPLDTKILVIECKSNWKEYLNEYMKLAEKSKKFGVPILLVYQNKTGLSAFRIEPRYYLKINLKTVLREGF